MSLAMVLVFFKDEGVLLPNPVVVVGISSRFVMEAKECLNQCQKFQNDLLFQTEGFLESINVDLVLEDEYVVNSSGEESSYDFEEERLKSKFVMDER
ncbi:hypothetical protein LguiB_016818 [Lonicera macranthoides]